MEKPLDEKGFTPESTVHLWTVPRKHKGKRSKTEVVQSIREQGQLKEADLLPLSLKDLETLEVTISSVKVEGAIPTGRSKAPYIDFLKPLQVSDLSKLSVPTLKVLCNHVRV